MPVILRRMKPGTPSLFVKNGHSIVPRRATTEGAQKIGVPEVVRQRIPRLTSEAPTAGHPGESRMITAMLRLY